MKKEVFMQDGLILMKVTYLPLEPVSLKSFKPIEIKSNGTKRIKARNTFRSHVIC